MRRKRFGFLSNSGTIAATLTMLIVAGVGFFSGGVLFNPGGLNAKSGANIGGVSAHAELSHQCGSCHAPFWTNETMADRCSTCHTDIPAQWNDASTLHGNLHQNTPGLTCRNCHPDHRGANAALTDMSRVILNHDVLGYSLKAHQLTAERKPFECNDCHANGYKSFDQGTCSTCHAKTKSDFMQAHVEAFGSGCLGCHDGLDSYGHAFDHNKAAFTLSGKHAEVACGQCHAGSTTIAALKSTNTQCASCHLKDDPHEGQLGTNCESCHTSAGWSPSTFDHNLASFQLTGKHASAACTDCHTDKIFKGTPTDCYACHKKDDFHNGTLGTQCSTCHSTEGWKPAVYDHNLSTFKLTGKHTTAACLDCHKNYVFKGTPSDCYACHKKDDAHKGDLGTACGTCHTPEGWLPANFDHNLAKFKLTGKHATTACTSCHINNVFKGTPMDCYSCHAKNDVHAGQFGTACGSCHNPNGWLPASVNHDLFAFKLIGKHATIACTSCHINNVFKGAPMACYSCHAKDDAHAGQFGTACGTCHTPNGWKPATFDHNAFFPLTGGHAGLACTRCHTNGGYTGLSTACAACHADPAYHLGLFTGTACDSCHNTSSWSPASYNGPHPGGCDGNCINHENASCRDCHANNLMTATCTKCHDSNNPGGGGGGD